MHTVFFSCHHSFHAFLSWDWDWFEGWTVWDAPSADRRATKRSVLVWKLKFVLWRMSNDNKKVHLLICNGINIFKGKFVGESRWNFRFNRDLCWEFVSQIYPVSHFSISCHGSSQRSPLLQSYWLADLIGSLYNTMWSPLTLSDPDSIGWCGLWNTRHNWIRPYDEHCRV